MFTCSSGVSFLRNFPKNRVHDAASHSLSLVLFTFQMFYSIPLCVGESFRFFLHCSLLRVVMVVLSVFVFVPAPVYWCDPRGFVLHGLRKNLTNFSSVFTFCFLPKLCIFCVLCFCL